MEDIRLQKIKTAVEYIRSIIPGIKPLAGIVLGSGLGKLGDIIQEALVIPYKEIPGFSISTAIGHKGNLIYGRLGGQPVIAMQGRFHYYEGYPMEQVVLPIRVMALLGIKYLFVSNAAGGVNFKYKVGDLMLITDHINLLPNPLIGKNIEELGPRFPDMTRPYDKRLIAMMDKIASKLEIKLHHGVYLGSTGPTYETPAEYRFYRSAGADAVGMSTIPEVIAARHMDIPVMGISVITNEAHDDYDDDYVNDGDDVVIAADAAADRMTALVIEMVSQLGQEE